jgi:hypothetical protein
MCFDQAGFNQIKNRLTARAFLGRFFLPQFTIDDGFTNPNTGITDEYAGRSCDHFSNFSLRFSAKRAKIDFGRLSHRETF